MKKYLDLTGLGTLWQNVKAFVISKVPTKTSQLTNDSNFIDKTVNGNNITKLTVSGKVITYTKANGSTGTITTQDTNTDTKVTNTLATTTKAYITGTTSNKTNTGTQVFDTGVYLSTTAGELVATKFTGTLNGTASSANELTTARTLRTNLASTSTGSFDGSANITIGVTGTLGVANGGTGCTTLQEVRKTMFPSVSTTNVGWLLGITSNWATGHAIAVGSVPALIGSPTLANTVKSLSISGRTITVTKADGTTSTLTTQDTNTDTKVTNTVINADDLYITGSASTTTNTGTQIFSPDAKISFAVGTTTSLGNARLYLGNSTKEGVAGNRYGLIYLYGEGAYYHRIYGNASTGHRYITLPDKSGTVALTSDIPSTESGNVGTSITAYFTKSITSTSKDISYSDSWNGSSSSVTAQEAELTLSFDAPTVGSIYSGSYLASRVYTSNKSAKDTVTKIGGQYATLLASRAITTTIKFTRSYQSSYKYLCTTANSSSSISAIYPSKTYTTTGTFDCSSGYTTDSTNMRKHTFLRVE